MASFKADHVSERVRQAIESGRFKPGQQLPAETALAREWGVNHQTIRKGLGALVEEGLIVKQPRVGNFVRAEAGRRFAVGVGVVVKQTWLDLESHNPVDTLLRGLGRWLPADRFNLQVLPYSRGRLWQDAGELAVQRGLRGLVVVPEAQTLAREIEQLREAGMKTLLYYAPDFLLGCGFPWLIEDTVSCAIEIVERLSTLGHERIVVLEYQRSNEQGRVRGALQQWHEAHGRRMPQEMIIEIPNESVLDWSVLDALCEQLARHDGPTAVVVPDEVMAHRLIGLCYRQGLHIPEDFSLALTRNYARPLNPIALTSPDSGQLQLDMAVEAGRLMARWLDGQETPEHGRTMQAPVIWTSSVAPPPSREAQAAPRRVAMTP